MTDALDLSPIRIFKIVNAYQASAALKAALDLGLFTALGADSKTAAELARELGASERGVRILCDFLTVQELLEKKGSKYRSSPDAVLFLDKNSPAYFGSVASFMLSSHLMDVFQDIAGAVRKGGTLMEGEGTVEPEHEMWVDFARGMLPLMLPSAEFIADLVTRDLDLEAPYKVLDVAAGHGAFGIVIADRHPKAEIVALDWPAVLDVARENAEKWNVSDRHTSLAGSAFEVDFGSGYDLVLLTNFLHHFDPPTCTDLLKKVHAALAPGGKVATLEFVPNEDRVSPPDEARFAMIMLASTPSGDAYTFSQLEKMFSDAGFSSSELHRQEGPPQSVVLSRK